MRTQKTPEIAAAYHEAGHAVMSWYVKRSIKEVSIVPNSSGWGEETGGHVKLNTRTDLSWATVEEWRIMRPARLRNRIENDMMIMYAGPEAQVKKTPRQVHIVINNGEGDFEDANSLSLLLWKVQDEADAFAHWVASRAKKLITGELWPFVEAVAAALLERKRLTGADVRRVIRERQEALKDR